MSDSRLNRVILLIERNNQPIIFFWWGNGASLYCNRVAYQWLSEGRGHEGIVIAFFTAEDDLVFQDIQGNRRRIKHWKKD